MGKYRIYFDVQTEGWKAANLFKKVQDALMDVFWEEEILPCDGIKMDAPERTEDEEDAPKKEN